jgi:hypothetical protein
MGLAPNRYTPHGSGVDTSDPTYDEASPQSFYSFSCRLDLHRLRQRVKTMPRACPVVPHAAGYKGARHDFQDAIFSLTNFLVARNVRHLGTRPWYLFSYELFGKRASHHGLTS